jgi:PadR family transcriptional regulator PadR
MMANVRASTQTLKLLAALTAKAANWHYGYALSRQTDLQSGTLYPILMRLEERGWLETQWESPLESGDRRGRPPRHMYRLTAGGRAWATEALTAAKSKARVTSRAARLGAPVLERS